MYCSSFRSREHFHNIFRATKSYKHILVIKVIRSCIYVMYVCMWCMYIWCIHICVYGMYVYMVYMHGYSTGAVCVFFITGKKNSNAQNNSGTINSFYIVPLLLSVRWHESCCMLCESESHVWLRAAVRSNSLDRFSRSNFCTETHNKCDVTMNKLFPFKKGRWR